MIFPALILSLGLAVEICESPSHDCDLPLVENYAIKFDYTTEEMNEQIDAVHALGHGAIESMRANFGSATYMNTVLPHALFVSALGTTMS